MHGLSVEARRLVAGATDLTIADVLRTQAIVRPDDDALVMGERVLSYRELDDATERLAAGLIGIGLKRGDRLAVLSRNSIPFALLFLAAAKAGVAIAAMNWRSPPAELQKALDLVEPAAIAVADALWPMLDDLDAPGRRIRLDSEATGGADTTFGDLKAAQPDGDPDVHSEDIVSIVLTSGTTGDPKAVAISQRALIARAGVMGVDWSLDLGDGFVGWAPFFHISASDYIFTTVVLGGVYVVVDGFDADAIAAIIRARKIGWLFLIPGTIEKIVEALGNDPLPSGQVKVVGVMADLVPPDLRARISEMTGARYLNSFGMTETGLLPCSPSFADLVGDMEGTLPKQQSALCRVKLVDENDDEVPDGAPGQLLVRSLTLASGYWNNEEATARAFAGRWFHTGDVLQRNPDGTLQFVGRVSGMIKSGGENIYPAEIERALLGHPDVTEAAVIGVAHEKWGETPLAFVSLADGTTFDEGRLKTFLRERIAAYKVPNAIRMIPLDAFPRNVTGKVDRRELAKRFPADAKT